MSSDSIVIVGARRTPQGRLMGKLSNYSALDLAVAAGKAALGDIPPEAVDTAIVGNVLPPVINVSRQMALKLGIPQSAVCFTVNMLCASGLKAVTQAANAIATGEAEVVLCGGTESMTNAPHLLPRARAGYRLGDGQLVDSLLMGLNDPHIKESMTHTAQRLAERFDLSREAQDAFSYASQQKTAKAQENGDFARELIALPELDYDEHPRADTTLERLGSLKPILGSGTSVTAGNASGINDGAAMLVLCKRSTAEKNGWKPLAEMRHYASIGCDPAVMGEGPVHAIRKLLSRSGGSLNDFDQIEINEAFAAQTLACLKQLDLDACDPRVNPQGGAIALGHPVGASGSRLAVHLVHRIAAGEIGQGLASLCVGGGMGIAATFVPVR